MRGELLAALGGRPARDGSQGSPGEANKECSDVVPISLETLHPKNRSPHEPDWNRRAFILRIQHQSS